MSEKCKCECALPWLSGFFAAPAIVHLIRLIAGWDVAWKGNPISTKTSVIILIICGVLSVIFGLIACKKHKENEGGAPSCC